MAKPRLAHPYRDTQVIDRRAPRFNQLIVALLTGAALLSGLWWLDALMGLQLLVGLTFGRRWCLTCLFYFEVLQPRFGEGELEDSRPPKLANALGAGVLNLSTLLFLAGLSSFAWVLVALVFALAALAALTGICAGCLLHRALFGACEVCELPR